MSTKTNDISNFDEEVKQLKKSTGIINEDTIGCFLSNYGDPNICCGFRNSGCKRFMDCKLLSRVHQKKVEEKQNGTCKG